MKKFLILFLGMSLISLSLSYGDCYEPTYHALECDSQGFDPCVTLPCNDGPVKL